MTKPGPLDSHPVLNAGILRGFHLLESDAGTGKTWTIAGLVVRALVELELEIDRILVVTFTKAATAELRARIRERVAAMAELLEAALAGEDTGHGELFCRTYLARIGDREAALRRLKIALAGLDEAAVHTIHGYCQRVIDEHGLTIGVAGGVDVGEADDGWIEALVDDWWRRQVVPAAPAVLALFVENGVDPEGLARRVRMMDTHPGARPEPLAGAPGDWRALADELAGLRARAAAVLAAESAELLDWLGVRGRVNGKMIQHGWASGWLAELAAWADAAAGQPLGATGRKRLIFVAGRLSQERFAEAVGERPMPPGGIPALCSALAALLARADEVLPMLAQAVWHEGEARRQQRRRGGSRLAFDDLLAIVDEALSHPDSGSRLASQLRERHPFALIDECQDTDTRQWSIFRRIHLVGQADDRPGGMVLVGDPKQAIYAFRGADVYAYLDARNAGPEAHALRENQRSVAGLVDAVNALFDAGDPFGVPGIGFSPARVGQRPRRRLTGPDGIEPGRLPGEPERAPLTVLRFSGDGEGGALDAERAAEQAVALTVAEIRRLLTSGLRLDGAPVAPADIAVLVDAHHQGSRVKRALTAIGIGAVEISRDRVVESSQAEELARWLAAVAEPADSGLLRAALLAAPAGFDAAGLDALAADPKAWNAWIEYFANCRERWVRHGAQAALRGLLFDTGAAGRLAALRDGERRLTNLLHLFELIAASGDAAQGPRQAWRWLVRAGQDGGQAGEAFELRLDSDENLVRILTVHRSKGLEFPFVFLPFAWQGRDTRADTPFVYHLAPSEPAGSWQAVLALSGQPGAEAVERYAAEQAAESMRRLYVALTRAEQRCHLVWGPAKPMAASPLAGRLAELAGLPPEPEAPAKSGKAGKPDDAAARIQALAAAADAWQLRARPGSVAIVAAQATADVPAAGADAIAARPDPASAGEQAGAALAVPAAAGAGGEFTARRFGGWIPAPWVRTSFSRLAERLIAGGASGDEADPSVFDPGHELPDHDQAGAPDLLARIEPPADASPPTAVPAQDIRFAFPAGAQAGTCLHGILEHGDFRHPLDRRLVSSQLARAGFDHQALAGDTAAWLDGVLDSELRAPDGRRVALRRLAPADGVREMDFLLPGEGVDEAALLAAVASELPLDPGAAGPRWSGFLRGFIDLVFRQDGRWYVLDWKSNRLGGSFADYGPAALDTAMRGHAYSLQACLYLLVLHRLLRLRVPGYDWDRDVGGAFWVFLRGVQPAGAGEPTPGVHASKPSRALIERLDRLFGGRS